MLLERHSDFGAVIIKGLRVQDVVQRAVKGHRLQYGACGVAEEAGKAGTWVS